MNELIRQAFEESIACKRSFLEENLHTLEKVVDLIVRTFSNGHKLLIFGNGGSALRSGGKAPL